MKAQLILVVAALAFVAAQTPTPPSLPEDYQAAVIANYIPWGIGDVSQVVGYFGVSYSSQRQVLSLNESIADVVIVNLFGENKQYVFVPAFKHCELKALNQTQLKPTWSWLPFSTYKGQKSADTRMCDVWSISSTAVAADLFVQNGSPVRFVTQLADAKTTSVLDFASFNPSPVPDTYFNIPDYCVAPASASSSLKMQQVDTSLHFVALREKALRLMNDLTGF